MVPAATMIVKSLYTPPARRTGPKRILTQWGQDNFLENI